MEDTKTEITSAASVPGEVKIASDVVATIAGMAAFDVDGVASMQDNAAREIMDKVGVHNARRGVKVAIYDGKVQVKLSLVVGMGANVPKVCANIQETVKETIENMTGLAVAQVDIHIVGVG
jgi:uncharacterized alkaline shock family protein YloU